jgi:hypothetical protein
VNDLSLGLPSFEDRNFWIRRVSLREAV